MKTLIPQPLDKARGRKVDSQLFNLGYTSEGKQGGLTGKYYKNIDLTGPSVTRADPGINFKWGRKEPPILRKLVAPPEERMYTVRFHFMEPDTVKPGERVFGVSLQGRKVIERLDIVKAAGGPKRILVREFRGIRARSRLTVTLNPQAGQAVLCGLELAEKAR
ncbi:MAG: malectin domain-containing carbohydrate-binding protein [Planctomycetota bacterium]|nr:malectin domain-containing carbohydrate-binding protein [Planctomycetota bacterium]